MQFSDMRYTFGHSLL